MYIEEMTDQEIVTFLLQKNKDVTYFYFYKKCYPLFHSLYMKYYTDCESCVEFINEIYLYVMSPLPDTGKCKLDDFGFRCSLTMWLKIVAEHYCHQLYAVRGKYKMDFMEPGDRNEIQDLSFNLEFQSLDMDDVQKILQMMSNKRYREIIRLRYLEEKSNEETAQILAMSMDNFYNKHRLAKVQFRAILRKEGLI